MLKDKNFWKIHFKWGILLGVMLAGIEILKMFSRKVDYQAAQLLDLAMIIGFILVLHLGVKEFKEVYPARLSFAKAYLSCIVTSFIGVVLLFGYDMLHYSVIEKDGLQQKYTTALAKYKQNLAKDTLTNAELMAYTDTASAMLNKLKEGLLYGTGFDGYAGFPPDTDTAILQQCRDEINYGIELFQRYYTGKLLSKPEADKENYQLGNFTPYAKRVLMETLESYSEQNNEKSTTPYVQEIVVQTKDTLASIDPLEKRYNENKSHVPRYDKNGQYAAVSAMMYMLYGMFFGLFVAMFNYTSKKPIEEFVPSENDEAETTNP